MSPLRSIKSSAYIYALDDEEIFSLAALKITELQENVSLNQHFGSAVIQYR